jgi:hypothetical protein
MYLSVADMFFVCSSFYDAINITEYATQNLMIRSLMNNKIESIWGKKIVVAKFK